MFQNISEMINNIMADYISLPFMVEKICKIYPFLIKKKKYYPAIVLSLLFIFLIVGGLFEWKQICVAFSLNISVLMFEIHHQE
jgi:hypothetical protein